jgi:hypothetical protein
VDAVAPQPDPPDDGPPAPRHRRGAAPEPGDEPGPDASLVDLLSTYHRHVLLLVAARTGRHPLPPEQVVHHALVALTIAHAVIDDLGTERWPIIRDALAHGATPEQVGAATGGLEPDELAAGLAAWASQAEEHRS